MNQGTSAAERGKKSKRDTLLQHLGISALSASEMMAAVNVKRDLLGLAKHTEVTGDTILDEGLDDPSEAQVFNKAATLLELSKLSEKIAEIRRDPPPAVARLMKHFGTLQSDPQLLVSLHQRALVEQGLELVEGPECPMCDHEWPDEAQLLSHLHAKQKKSEAGGDVQMDIMDQAANLSFKVEEIITLLREAHRLATGEKATDFLTTIETWGKDLASMQDPLKLFPDVLNLNNRLEADWAGIPSGFDEALATFVDAVKAKPDQSATVAAQSYLINAQQRFQDYKKARQEETNANKARDTGKIAYDAWCAAMEAELDALYEAVEDDFSKFYRLLNDGDEQKFVARLKASEGRLDFDVNFYERGLFPPGAFHSEGHQDGMGGRCCTEALELGTRPTRDGIQAVRSKRGWPSPVIRLRICTPILASDFWFSKSRDFSLGPITAFQRPMRVSPRLR